MRLPVIIGIGALALVLASPLVLHAQQQGAPATGPSVAASSKEAPANPATPPAAQKSDAPVPPAEPPKAEPAAPAAPAKAEKPKPIPARDLFGAAKTPSPLAARSIGSYAKGCLAGAKALPIDGPAWQAMRLSRNRNWGHPALIELVTKLANDAKAHDGWPGLLVGDLAQPRGGPMLNGHASHQVGLDADIWLNPMPDHRLTPREREDLSATSMLASYDAVDPKIWTDKHVLLIRRAASYTEVERIFVHPAIKKALCEATAKQTDKERVWLAKVQPWYGHHYHFHIRIACPKGSTNCEPQPSRSADVGCGKEVTHWLALVKPKAHPPTPVDPKAPPAPVKPPIMISELPADCRTVLTGGPDGVAIPTQALKPPVANVHRRAVAKKRTQAN